MCVSPKRPIHVDLTKQDKNANANGGEISSGQSELKENSMKVEGSKWEPKRWILICFGVQDRLGHFRGKEHPEEQASVGDREH